LYEEHVKLNALMAPFAGFNMPIHYGSIIEEAKHTRSACSIFDICHMGEFLVKQNPAECSFDGAITVAVTKMKNNTCKYGFLLNENGTAIDDLIVYRIKDDEWMIVVNAGNIRRDFETIKARMSGAGQITNISDDTAKFDIQGPLAYDVMKTVTGTGPSSLKYFGFGTYKLLGGESIISRTGYTGELGFEIYIDSNKAVELWNKLVSAGAKPAGLGSRDILRLEAGLPLYGDELTETMTPMEAGMERFIDFEKEFTGRAALLDQKNNGVSKKLCGFLIDGRRTPRHENKIISGGAEAGFVTSGVFSPHLNCGIGMGYVKPEIAVSGSEFEIDLGRGSVRATVSLMPFVKETSIRKNLLG
jgi:aminomethyltransferase